MRRRLSTVLLVLGLVLVSVTLLVAYLARTVLDPNAFSTRLVAALGRPGVSAFVAQRIADGVVASNRDLTGVKPVITIFAQGVVNSEPFHALARRGALEAHRLIFSTGAENLMLAVPDVGVLLRGTLETVSSDIARRVPANVQAVIQTRLTGAIAVRVVETLRTAARIRLLARLGLVLGLLLIVFAVTFAPDRRQAVLDASIGLLSLAAVLALIVPLGRSILGGTVADPTSRAALGDLWTVFAGGLRTWAIGLAAAGLMLLASAAAFLERVRLREVLRRGVAELTNPQLSPGWQALRITIALAVGGFAMVAPLATLTAATVVAGTLLMALAVYELVAMLAPNLGSAAAGSTPRLNPALAIGLTCILLAAGAMGAFTLVLRFRPKVAAAATDAALQCNQSSALCARRLNEITFAGAHNAMGSADRPYWMFPNQDAGISKLLHLGVRAVMLDVWKGYPVGDRIKTDFGSEEQRRKFEAVIGPEAFAAAMRIRDRLVGESGKAGLYMCHGFCELGAAPFDSALAEVAAFLVGNPSDVVLMILEDYVPPADIAAALGRQGLTPFLYTGPSRGPYPTLQELIASNQRLVVMGENETGGLPWYHPAFEVMQETPYTFHSPEEFSCRPNRGDKANPILLVNHWIETTPTPRPSNAQLVNAEAVLLRRARECRQLRGKSPNVIAVDFAATGDVVRAAAVLNGVEQPLSPDSTR